MSTPPPPSTSRSQASIQIKNLQLPCPIVAPDVWGNSKEQPASVSVHLQLHASFSTASDHDKLDDSTIHYGNLAKRIRSHCGREGLTSTEVMEAAEEAVASLAMKAEGTFIVAKCRVELLLSKASMLGSGVVVTTVVGYDQRGQVMEAYEAFQIRDVVVPTLIGVNAYERGLKQPLVVTLTLDWRCASGTRGSQKALSSNMERELVQIVQATAYETLETLVEHIFTELVRKVPGVMLPGTTFHLRTEKPRAIAFADAPAIEIKQTIPSAASALGSSTTSAITDALAGLSVVKPYSAA